MTLVAEKRTLHRELGRYIARARTRLGLTQEQLAERLGVTQTFVGRVEAGKRRPAPEDLADWAEALAVWPPDLLREAGVLRDTAGLDAPPADEQLDRWWRSLSRTTQAQLRAIADAMVMPMIEQVPGSSPAREQDADDEPAEERDAETP